MKFRIRILITGLFLLSLSPSVVHAQLWAGADGNLPMGNATCDIQPESSTNETRAREFYSASGMSCPSDIAEDYSVTSEGIATHGSLHASASAMIFNGTGYYSWVQTASSAGGRFHELITIDGGARNGTAGTMQFTVHASGGLNASGTNPAEEIKVWSFATFRVWVEMADGQNVSLLNRNWSVKNDIGQDDTAEVSLDTSHDPFTFVFGEPFTLKATLSAGVEIKRRTSADSGPPLSGSGFSNFGSTGEITGIAVYDTDGAPLGEGDYTLISDSGQFSVPSVVSSSSSTWGSLKARFR